MTHILTFVLLPCVLGPDLEYPLFGLIRVDATDRVCSTRGRV
jgi:hypothetical protein